MSEPPRRAALIVNARSRLGQSAFDTARAELVRQGFDLQAKAVRDPSAIGTLVSQAVNERLPLIAVGGGDGTMSAVARHFVGSDAVLGVLPLGTGNAFARDLQIPNNIVEACKIVASGAPREIDLGFAADDYFVNVATVGLTTLIAEELTDSAKKTFGKLVYAAALIRALRKVRPFEATLETPEGVTRVHTVQVVIGNGRYHAGPFPLAPEATITDGALDVYALSDISRGGLIRYALSLPFGKQAALSGVQGIRTRGGLLTAQPSQRVTVDGEIMFRTPMRFGIRPKALKVMVRERFDG